MHEYIAYGLSVHSEIPLPELTLQASETPDVTIRLGGVPAEIKDPRFRRVIWQASPGEWLMDMQTIGRYYVRDGRDIRIEPYPEADDADLRAFLFSSTWGALLHQRGVLLLHASAVHMPSGAVAVSGKSGAGKSTLLTSLLGRGYPLLADDKVAVVQDGAQPIVIQGHPTIRLWADALERLGTASDGLPRLREGFDKFLYRVERMHPEPSPFRALFILAPSAREDIAIERLDPMAAYDAVLRSVYRRKLIKGFGMEKAHFGRITALATAIPVYRIQRPQDGDTVAAITDAIEDTLGHLAPS